MAFQQPLDDHLINAIKGLGPAPGAIYTLITEGVRYNLILSENLCFTLLLT
jgi:hypothetical protein